MEGQTHGDILVVEDDSTIAMGLVAALEHERFIVRHAENEWPDGGWKRARLDLRIEGGPGGPAR